MSEIELDALDGLSIIEQMTKDGWLYKLTNYATQKTHAANILMLKGNGHYCLFGKDKRRYYQWHHGCHADDLTEAVKGAARKALKRGYW